MRARLAGLAAVAALVAVPALAGGYHAPRNRLGQPDLQGVWNTHFVTPLEARPDAPALTLPEAEAAVYARKLATETSNFPIFQVDPEVAEIARDPARSQLALVRGQRRTRQIVEPPDGRLPLTRSARAQLTMIETLITTRPDTPFGLNNPEDRNNWERCLVGQGQPPVAILGDINPRQILQTRDAVVILSEYGPDLRIARYADAHGPLEVDGSPLGDSIAHWEGETLVVETIGLPAKDTIRPLPTLFVSTRAKVVERLTRVSETELLYQFTVVDPGFYTGPWLAEYSLYRSDRPIYEFACHEGNYSLPNILAGARASERDAAARPAAAVPK